MIKERYVAAIEISSSKVIGAVGKIHADGKLDVLAVEQEKATESVRYGIIQNVEETAIRVKRVIDHLEMNPAVRPNKISGVYIGLSGRSMRSVSTQAELAFQDDTMVTHEIIERLRKKASEAAIDSSLEIIDIVPRSYHIGHSTTREPVGNLCNGIRASYDLIACRPQIKKNVQRLNLHDRFGVHNRGFVVTQLAAAQLVLTEEEKRLGCMLVDMGAETTAVTIYKDGDLRYFATLPMGSRNITRDIMSLDQLEATAETIKIQSGNAMPEGNASSLDIHGVRLSDVSKVVVARAEEIVANIVEQITYAELRDSDLPRGIILMGGGCKLNNMDNLIADISKMHNVRIAQLPQYVTLNDNKVPAIDALQVISVLYSGATETDSECITKPDITDMPGLEPYEQPEEETTQPIRRTSRFDAWKTKLAGIFIPKDEDDDNEIIDE